MRVNRHRPGGARVNSLGREPQDSWSSVNSAPKESSLAYLDEIRFDPGEIASAPPERRVWLDRDLGSRRFPPELLTSAPPERIDAGESPPPRRGAR